MTRGSHPDITRTPGLPPSDLESPLVITTAETRQRRTELRLTGELDMQTAPLLRAALAQLPADGCPTVVIDLSELDFVCCIGLSVLDEARNDPAANGTELILRNPSWATRRLLHLTGLHYAFQIEPADEDSTVQCAHHPQ